MGISRVWGRTKLSLISFKVFAPKSSGFGAYHLIFAGKIGPVSFTVLPQQIFPLISRSTVPYYLELLNPGSGPGQALELLNRRLAADAPL